MIILLDTSQPTSYLTLIDRDKEYIDEWDSGRGLAKSLLGYLDKQLTSHNSSWKDLDYIGVKAGPGSFTGLRIGLTVMNTIAVNNKVPIVSGVGENWKDEVREKINLKKDEKVVLPVYDKGPNITVPKK